MYSEEIESLIAAALADGVLTDKERSVLMRKAEEEGIDADEFEMVLDARLVELKKKTELPKNEKVGNIKKCPNCGASLSGIISKCPECGFEFNNIKVAGSVEELSRKLQGKEDEERASVISTFPIPNAKQDLFELISHLDTLRETEQILICQNAAHNKRKQCIKIAKSLYPGDPVLSAIADQNWWHGLNPEMRFVIVLVSLIVVISSILLLVKH